MLLGNPPVLEYKSHNLDATKDCSVEGIGGELGQPSKRI